MSLQHRHLLLVGGDSPYLLIVGLPTTVDTGATISTFTVEAKLPDGTTDTSFTGSITISKATGVGTLNGTLTQSAVSGVATFSGISITTSTAGVTTIAANASGYSQGLDSLTVGVGSPASYSDESFVGWASDNISQRGHLANGNVPYQDFDIYEVTSLATTGANTLYDALMRSRTKPQLIVFGIAGVIDWQYVNSFSKLFVTNGNFTIAGQTAPNPGIFIRKGFAQIPASNIVIQHLRVHPGAAGRSTSTWFPDAFSPGGKFQIYDHCTLGWSVDEIVGTWPAYLTGSEFNPVGGTLEQKRAIGPSDITYSHCIMHEALRFGYTDPSVVAHNLGLLIGDTSLRNAVYKNLFVSNGRRNPLFKCGTSGLVVNNYILNPGDWAISAVYNSSPTSGWSLYTGGLPEEQSWINIEGNFVQHGPNSTSDCELINVAPATDGKYTIYVPDSNNMIKRQNGTNGVLWSGSLANRTYSRITNSNAWHSSVTPMNVNDVRAELTDNVGARPWNRDRVESRLIDEMNGLQSPLHIYDETEAEGFYNINTVTRPFVLSDWIVTSHPVRPVGGY